MRFWLAVLVASGVLVAGAVVAVTGYYSQSGPDDVVRSYFAALGRGDARTALSYGDVPPGDRSYLTAEVLDIQRATAPIMSLRTAPESAGSIKIAYTIGGHQLTDSVPMIKRDGRWRLAASAVRKAVSLSAAGARATFAGTAVPNGQPLLFPGALPIRFDTPNLTVSPEEGVVRFGGAPAGSVPVTVSAAGRQVSAAAVLTALTECLTATEPAALCPVPSGTAIRAVPASLRGTISGTPTLQADVAPQADGKLLITGSVAVQGSYQALDYQNQVTPTSGRFDVSFSAHSYASDAAKIVWDAR